METPEEVSGLVPARLVAASELEAAQRQIAQLQQQLAQSGLALEDFTYSVSHDLRASLRHVASYVKIVREDLGEGVDSSIAGHLDRASEAAQQMTRLMDGLLLLSRIGRAELQMSDVDLSRLVTDARGKLETGPALGAVQWHVAPDLPAVRGDVMLLGQALVHLLGNACKATRERPVAHVYVDWTRVDGRCELHIRDNGIGFDPRFQDRLFRVFQRLHSPKQFEGIGIGLALARRVAERHGGSIRAEGAVEGGCQISMTLPLAANSSDASTTGA